MAKTYHCAACGVQLQMFRKAIPSRSIIMNLIEPHECDPEAIPEDLVSAIEDGGLVIEETPTTPQTEDKLQKAFDAFPFVGKINKEVTAMEIDPLPTGDRRPKEHKRQEIVTSTAPKSLLDLARDATGPTEDGRELEEPDGEET